MPGVASEAFERCTIVAKIGCWPDMPLSPLISYHALGLGIAEHIEAVHERDADLDFGCLTVPIA